MDFIDSQSHIRNFAIIAHIDHGKSTLADRLLEITGTVQMRDMQAQLLDSNPIERERGITIKLAPVRMVYKSQITKLNDQQKKDDLDIEISDLRFEGSKYILNLIDTPGHVDFSYEVSRSLAACEGALLVVDATQGVQAQTLANLHQAREHKLTIIPIINKIDLPNARINETLEELKVLGFKEEQILTISAKIGTNVDKVIEAIITRIPAPTGGINAPLRGLVFSSLYDAHKGVVVFVRVVDGSIHHRITNKDESTNKNQSNNSYIRTDSIFVDKLRFMASGAEVTPIEIGYFTPAETRSEGIKVGEVGYIATGLKDIRFAKVGDTVTLARMSNDKFQMSNKKQNSFSIGHLAFSIPTPLPGYHEPKPMVFLGLFPINSDELTAAREAMERLRLSDSAFSFKPISSLALGNGFHCGFLGLLHAEIVQERLSREFNLNMIATAPSVEYRLKLNSNQPSAISHQQHTAESRKLNAESLFSITSASEFPDPTFIEEVREPIMSVTIFTPKKYVGPVMQLSQEKRGEYVDLKYVADQAEFTYLIPLSEMIVDFFDRLKSVTEGYASLDYEFYEFRPVEVVKLDILVNKEKVDALSLLIVKDQAERRGREITERLAMVIPRQQFQIPIQAAIGGQVVARADVKAFRKDVIQKLYGGDRTRKDKLLEAQKKGKERMKQVGRVSIPQEAFFKVLKRS